ncbi:MAG: penicillin-binding protein [Blastocatellia bacterium]|nr:penicillin-binding protein [Blastocatellia bacterium]
MATMTFLLLLQNASNVVVSATQTTHPERRPALFSLIYVAGLAFVALILFLSLFRYRRRRANSGVAYDLSPEIRKRLGSTATNRGLKILRWVFVLLALSVFGFHVYWARYAEGSNERFDQLSYKDLRNRRLSESTLRGWILDRSGRLDKAFALYKRNERGEIVREYPMDSGMSHLLGSERGDPGLERALFGVESGALPEALQVVTGKVDEQKANKDVRLTIDRDLQQAVIDQLKGKHGAVVILNPQTGEVLAMYSNPSFSLNDVKDEATWIRLNADERDRPLVNRALGTYYIPGSTFKTLVMIAAHRAGIQDSEFNCTGSGFVAAPGAKPILDDGGPSEVHGRIGIDTAYEVSCNQYFSQLAVKLGPERLAEAARLVGIGAYDTPEEAVRGKKEPQIWNASSDAIRRALAPREATIVTGPRISKFDLALEGYGQGYAGQMTPFQMALLAATVANSEGKLMKPRIEFDRAPEAYNQVVTPQIGAALRSIMGLVTTGPRGTGRGVFAPVTAAGISSGGKTGTAQKDVPLYDPKTGQPVMKLQIERDPKGNVISQREVAVFDYEHPRIDGWFLCIAPLDRPTIAMSVIIEGGGYGSRSAAPVAAALVLKAKDLGLLGGIPPGSPQTSVQQAGRRPLATRR